MSETELIERRYAARFGRYGKHVWIFVNGILTVPGQADNWNGRATTFCLLRGQLAEKCEYFVSPIARMFGQRARARKLRATLLHYQARGFAVSLACHSNGADVALKALRESRWPEVRRLCLIAAACDADCQRNGLNEAVEQGRVNEVKIYVGKRDLPLRFVKASFLAKRIGYGALGYDGPMNVSEAAMARVVTHVEPDFGHSSWFDESNFDVLMEDMTGLKSLD